MVALQSQLLVPVFLIHLEIALWKKKKRFDQLKPLKLTCALHSKGEGTWGVPFLLVPSMETNNVPQAVSQDKSNPQQGKHCEEPYKASKAGLK